MAISDLEPRQGNVELTAEVIEKGDIREFEKFGKQGRVCSGKIKDQTGQMVISLWNEQIDQINVGDVIKIVNGYVSEWQGEKQLSTGKFGTLEVVGKSDDAGDSAEKADTGSGKESAPDQSEKPVEDTAVSGDELQESIDEEEVI